MKNTPENDQFCRKHVARLLNKAFAPTEKPAMDEVVRALLESASDPTHAQRIVDELARERGPFPEPAAFRDVARATATMRSQPDPECQSCSGIGQVVVTRGGVERTVRCRCGSDPECVACYGAGEFRATFGGVSGAERCQCWALRPIERRPWEVEVTA